ncbi:Hypothetical Protein FCC1311_107732 [Hondaea fermentalgiana]|uniref:Uncharacterized protein n=1 Tax=Hondaea fermentalgiana TaxID=2315210 RepID=A0A2R5GW43_9STRA|nr:Hypothetical Protein FCC1311_107732 [Hondaea fermentalgiana]|eukprot:GBG34549.1 Hypothetical Protein FCC1311_107732 [Hondaea fermentalgiana]
MKVAQMEAAVARAERTSAVLDKLSKKSSAQKRKTKLSKHKHDWQQEFVALAAEASNLERDLAGFMQNNEQSTPTLTRRLQGSSSTRRLLDAGAHVPQRRAKSSTKTQESAILNESAMSEEWRELQTQADEEAAATQEWRNDLFTQLQEMAEILEIVRRSLAQEGDTLHATAQECMKEAINAKAVATRSLRSDVTSLAADADDPKESQIESKIQAVRFRLEHIAAGYDTVPSVGAVLEQANADLDALHARQMGRIEGLQTRAKAHKRVIPAQDQVPPSKNKATENPTHVDAEATPSAQTVALWEALDKLHRETVLRGRGLGLFLERASLQFPQLGRARIEEELSWLEERRRLAALRKDAARSFLRDMETLADNAEKRLGNEMEAYQTSVVLQGEKDALAARRAVIQGRLETQRREAAIREAQEAEIRAAQEAEAREEKERREALEELEREHKRRLVAAFQREREFEKSMQALQEAQHEETLLEAQRARAPENERRVQYRAQELERKQREQAAELERARLEGVAAEQRLDHLRTQVPYFGKLQEIVPSKERLEQHTFSSAVVPDAAYRNYAREGLFQNPGFSDAQVCGDVRFRVVEALRAKGLQNSSYAHTLLTSMASGVLAQKNLQTSLG